MKKSICLLFLLMLPSICLAQSSTEIKKTSSGVRYQIVVEGRGPKPIATDRVTFHYKATFEDGSVFDDSYKRNQPLDVLVNQMIKGLAEGLTLMPLGSKYTFYIPSSLAYGEQGSGLVKPNSNLIFSVELLKVNDTAFKKEDVKANEKNKIGTEKNLSSNPDNKYYRKLAIQNLKEKNYNEAIRNSTLALDLEPTDDLAQAYRGLAKENLNDTEGAIEDYTAVIAMKGDTADNLYFRRGNCYEKQKNYGKAKMDYNKMLSLKPDFALALEGKNRIDTIELNAMFDQSNDKIAQLANSIGDNRPFMVLIKKTNGEIEVVNNQMKAIVNKIDEIPEVSKNWNNKKYSDLIVSLANGNSEIFKIIMTRSKELAAFNDAKWPTFKAAYRKTLVLIKAKEKDLKEFDEN